MRERGWIYSSIAALAAVLASCGGGGESGSPAESAAPASDPVDQVADSVVTSITDVTSTTAVPETPTTARPAATAAPVATEQPETTESESVDTEPPPEKTKKGSSSQAPPALAEPDEIDVTVYQRLSESVPTSSAYSGMTPAQLVAAGQAPCHVLLAGGDVREAIEATIAASPAAGQPFGADEQTLTLLLVTRGAALWCPEMMGDEETFKTEVIATIVDVFFEG